MLKNTGFKIFSNRQAISVAVSVCIAFMIQYIYSFSNEYWMVLSAFLVGQTTRGTPFKQGMLIFMVMVSAIIISSLLLMSIKSFAIIYIIVSILFMGSSAWGFMSRPQSSKTYFITMLFAIVLLIAIFSPAHSLDTISNRIFDCAIGAFIAILCRIFILPVKWDVAFKEGILPILNALSAYTQAISTEENIAEKRLEVEQALLHMYPSWIYESGFNRGLRSGFRFFLIHVEQVAEVLLSMNDLIARTKDVALLHSLRSNIENVMQKNQELLAILSEYFKHETMSQLTSDFTSDMTEFESVLQRVIPDNMDVLAISPKYLPLAALGRDMRDLRQLLLQLVMALPVKVGEGK